MKIWLYILSILMILRILFKFVNKLLINIKIVGVLVMIDKYTSLNDAIYQDPRVADILMSYGVPCYGNTENQLSSLEDVGIRYGIDINSVIESP